MMKTDFRRSQRDCVYCALHINSALYISHYHQLENVCQLNMHDINRTRQHHSLSNKIKGCVNVGHYTYFETHHPNDCARALTYERFLTSKSFKWINAEWAFFFHSLSFSLYLQRKKEYAQQKKSHKNSEQWSNMLSGYLFIHFCIMYSRFFCFRFSFSFFIYFFFTHHPFFSMCRKAVPLKICAFRSNEQQQSNKKLCEI